jgi:very-short-patch-repair endonuclease
VETKFNQKLKKKVKYMKNAMMDILAFDKFTIRRVNTSDNIWFCGRDIAKILGYKDTNQGLRKNVSDKSKVVLKYLCAQNNIIITTTYNMLNAVYINRSGLQELLTYSKQTNLGPFLQYCKDNNFIDEFSLVKRLGKEQEYIGYIMNVFRHLNIQAQYSVAGFRIDLYFIDDKVAIECDEHNHNDRCPIYEEERQASIEKELQCKFVRFNPDSTHFSIFDLINTIIKTIY